jgi:hypothetical protein
VSAVLEARDAPFRLTSPIDSVTKLDDGTLIVHTVVTTETPDNQRGVTRGGERYDGEIIDYDAVKRAAPGLMEWASVKEMHDQDTASGTILRLHFDDEARRVTGDLHVVDPVAVKKVLTKVYKAVSIGGYKRATRLMKMAGRTYRRVVELIWDEISLVDKPANKDARFGVEFVLAKRDREESAVTATDTRTIQQIAIDAALEADRADAGEEPLAKAAAADPGEADAGRDTIATMDEQDEPLAKAEGDATAETAAAIADDAAATEVAEEPLAKAEADPDAAATVVTAAAVEPANEPLRKYANTVVLNLQGALGMVIEAMACEAAEGDANDVAALQAIADAIQASLVSEAGEPPTAAEQLGAIAETIENAAAIAAADLAVTGDLFEGPMEVLAVSYGRVRAQRVLSELEVLAKAGARNSGVDRDRIDRMHDLTVELGTSRHDHKEAAGDGADEPLAKADVEPGPSFIEQIRTVLVDVLPPGKLEAIEQRLAAADERSTAQGQTLERIAKAEAGGGPANSYGRIYEAASRGEASGREESPGAVLEAAAGLVDDPRLKAELGNAAALLQIKGARAGIG